MNQTIKLPLSLAVICAVAATVLAFAYGHTADRIRAAELAERTEAVAQVLPEFDNQPMQDTHVCTLGQTEVTFYRARQNGAIVAVAGQGSARGYGGPVTALAGIEPDGAVRVVVISAHTETAGIGTGVTDRKRTRSLWKTLGGLFAAGEAQTQPNALPPSEFLDQFTGRSFADSANWALRADGGPIDAVSGATVTSRAVATAVTRIAEAYRAERDAILTTPAP